MSRKLKGSLYQLIRGSKPLFFKPKVGNSILSTGTIGLGGSSANQRTFLHIDTPTNAEHL
jgi:hypothetical protein